MVTKKDVADLAGVGKTTVSRVMTGKGYVSELSRKKVLDAIEKLNYIPNNIAKNLNKNSGNIVAVLVEDLTNVYYMQIISAMSQKSIAEGLIVSVFSVNMKNINTVLEHLIANRVCCIINLALYTCDKKYIDILKELHISYMNLEGGNSLILNYEPGIIEVFEYLKERGKKSVAFIAGLEEEFIRYDSRLTGYFKCIEKYDFDYSPDLIIYGSYPNENGFVTGEKLVNILLERGLRPDAILCLNDVIAIGVLHGLSERGIRVPDDISVIGCDNIILSAFTTPSLASLDIDKEGQGETFINSVSKIERKNKYVFDAKLIRRNSLIK